MLGGGGLRSGVATSLDTNALSAKWIALPSPLRSGAGSQRLPLLLGFSSLSLATPPTAFV